MWHLWGLRIHSIRDWLARYDAGICRGWLTLSTNCYVQSNIFTLTHNRQHLNRRQVILPSRRLGWIVFGWFDCSWDNANKPEWKTPGLLVVVVINQGKDIWFRLSSEWMFLLFQLINLSKCNNSNNHNPKQEVTTTTTRFMMTAWATFHGQTIHSQHNLPIRFQHSVELVRKVGNNVKWAQTCRLEGSVSKGEGATSFNVEHPVCTQTHTLFRHRVP